MSMGGRAEAKAVAKLLRKRVYERVEKEEREEVEKLTACKVDSSGRMCQPVSNSQTNYQSLFIFSPFSLSLALFLTHTPPQVQCPSVYFCVSIYRCLSVNHILCWNMFQKMCKCDKK